MSTSTQQRHKTAAVNVGGVVVGGGAPIVVQSMTNTDTADVEGTARQVAALAAAGSELVRITVDRDEAAAAVPHIRDRLAQLGVNVPLVGDFHYIGHKLLADHPGCAEALGKYRINPGNVGFKDKRDRQFSAIIEMALKYNKPVRIGANWGSLDQELLTRPDGRERQVARRRAMPREVMHEAHGAVGALSAARAEELGLAKDRIILSAKVFGGAGPDCGLPRTRARAATTRCISASPKPAWAPKASLRRSAAMGVLLQQGIGDTVRISLTPEPNGDRTRRSPGGAGTVADDGTAHVRSAGCGMPRLRTHHVDDVPGTGLRYSGLHSQLDAGMEAALSGRRDA